MCYILWPPAPGGSRPTRRKADLLHQQHVYTLSLALAPPTRISLLDLQP